MFANLITAILSPLFARERAQRAARRAAILESVETPATAVLPTPYTRGTYSPVKSWHERAEAQRNRDRRARAGEVWA